MQSKSNKYRVYIETQFGYELKGIFKLEKVMNILDNHIINERKQTKALVIEISKECEYPFYLYAGNYQDYLKFKEQVNENYNEKILKRTKGGVINDNNGNR